MITRLQYILLCHADIEMPIALKNVSSSPVPVYRSRLLWSRLPRREASGIDHVSIESRRLSLQLELSSIRGIDARQRLACQAAASVEDAIESLAQFLALSAGTEVSAELSYTRSWAR